MKDFKDHEEQLKILRDRGLKITDEPKALKVLQLENYYGVINGYKDFFLQTDINNYIIPDAYIPEATFEEIYKLYTLDRDLRNLLLGYLLKFESSIKSRIAYRFSEKYKEPHAYLLLQNYSGDPEKLRNVLGLISTISTTISKSSEKNSPISHYLNNHNGVPLWVLVNYLTLGSMNYFFACLTADLQNKISKDFATIYIHDYKQTIHLTSDMIESVLKTVMFFRNVCAHGERLYNFKLSKPTKSSTISGILNIPVNQLNKGNLFTITSFLKLVLPKEEHEALLRELNKLFIEYSPSFKSVNFSNILLEMGFASNWNTYF